MKKLFLIQFNLLLFFAVSVQAQNQYNIFTYEIPAGFKQTNKNNTSLMLEKKEGKQYCQLFIYPVKASAGSIEKDFETNWNFFARNPSQKVGDPETTAYDTLNGWTVLFGASKGYYNNQMFAITVTAFTKNNFSYFIASVFTDKKYTDIAQLFSTEVIPDENRLAQNTNSSNTVVHSSGTTAPINKSAQVTTNFDDGWVSTYVGPYVMVARDNVQAWVFPVNDSLEKINRKPEEYFEDKYWRYATDRFFQTRNIAERPWQMSGPGTDKIFEAEVKNRQTGEEGFVAMRVICNSGRCQPVLAFAATKDLLYKSVFANYNSFEQALPYNKFMPTAAALQGTWQRIETGATDYYTIGGGFQGGSKKTSSKDLFIFNGDGNYESSHITNYNAATGAGPKPQIHKGSFSVNGTTVLLTNRRADESVEYECWLEAVDGGLELNLVNKKSAGLRYKLLRVE
jgi:hypothetical protein